MAAEYAAPMGLEMDLVLVLQRCRTYGAGCRICCWTIMNINWKWNAPVRGVFRIAAGILGVLLITSGGLSFHLHYQSGSPFVFDSTMKGAVAMLGWGTFFLIVAIRGRFVKRDIG